MVKALLLTLTLLPATLSAAGPRWDHSIKIDDPKLTAEVAARQCHKSFINAPELLEAWCEKAYEMGYWSALVPISLLYRHQYIACICPCTQSQALHYLTHYLR